MFEPNEVLIKNGKTSFSNNMIKNFKFDFDHLNVLNTCIKRKRGRKPKAKDQYVKNNLMRI
ncbi:hypothetical protein BpHYR1_018833 [Brachionus plicatilis]|uniref:Uncharacterized protein n=1 Tax=Brachionus plicatilis TaxID=10195 RepID=A0A3M7QQX0_BRAPC|nr:hypothetical protein BpHYR1_018833 [Brachionus plicatilis]